MAEKDIITTADGLPWTDVVPSFIKYALHFNKYKDLLFKYWRVVLLLASKKTGKHGLINTEVVVLGRPGVGKTVLRDMLTGEAMQFTYKLPNTSEDAERSVVSMGDWSRVFTVVPGQEANERDNWLNEALSPDSRTVGVIYVVDWGYTERASRFRSSDDLEAFRLENISAELKDFREVCVAVRKSHAKNGYPKWMLVASTKTDVYMDDLSNAQSHYSTDAAKSEFARVLRGELLDRVGADKFGFEAAPISSISQEFKWKETVVDSKLDDSKRKAMMLHFLLLVGKMRKFEG